MEYTSNLRPYVSRPDYLAEITLVLLHIRDTRASGRLSIRNAERLGLAHLYFNQARLGHITGDKGDGESMLKDLLTWTKGSVRFDPAVVVNNETINWQQAQLFTRWLSFLEIHGIMQGIPGARLNGLAQSLTAHLPREPIALPLEVEQPEEQEEVALSLQEQRLNAGVRSMIDRSPTEEQLQQLHQVFQRLKGIVHHASEVTQELAKRAVKTTQEGLLQAAETACQRALRAGDFMRQTFNEGRRQQIIQSMQDTAETIKLTVSQSVSQTDDDTQSPIGSSLQAELQALSFHPMSSFDPPSPVAGSSGEG